MPILFSNEIMSAVSNELKGATESVQIITAYCKEKAIEQLESYVPKEVLEKRIMLRFRLDDIVKGSTDFSVLNFCRTRGWKVYIRFDLHAKTYIVDGKRGFIGSANATNSGLSLNHRGNMEMGTLVDIDEVDMAKIETLYKDAIFVDEQIFGKLNEQYQNIESCDKATQYTWSNEIRNLFNPQIKTLFSHELPDTSEIVCGKYIPFLDMEYEGDVSVIRNSFRWSNVYLWLLNTLRENNGCMYFGAIAEKLHSAMVSDPKPYRKDVKVLLANLLALIEALKMDEIVIDRPNYSQRIRLVE